MIPRRYAALNKFKVSDRDAVILLTEFVKSAPADYFINQTSIRNLRQDYRKKCVIML